MGGIAAVTVFAFASWATTRSDDDAKIYGGHEVANIRTMPWMINIQTTSRFRQGDDFIHIRNFHCGGTLISLQYVLSACSCLFKQLTHVYDLVPYVALERFDFVAGTVKIATNDTDIKDPNVQARRPVGLRHHPKCSADGWPHNLAIAKMKEPFKLTVYVAPAQVPCYSEYGCTLLITSTIGTQNKQKRPQCSMAGWGAFDKEAKTGSPILKSSNVFIEVGENCVALVKNTYPHMTDGADEKICATGLMKNDSLCKGDSGGGLICKSLFFGVAGWIEGCDSARGPQIYERLDSDFLTATTCLYQTCRDALLLPTGCNKPPPDVIDGLCKPTNRPTQVTRINPAPRDASSSPWPFILLVFTIK